ncbi:methyltransferase domain-containing protein [Methylobacterium sp. NEAU 140]|uniref:class I SAM-dependent methyltransferase n=1 Tax=Methylobacterium sp. NEAU 140 TaxID=3064945 RepID=UPI002736F4A6|nr:methyltransferase domain-containing protein [Methylobacterium sp. NEAU 140]MDP4021556.1 methyltransferase domain-containing protein [Methylobacterium sp. NEAU 140]
MIPFDLRSPSTGNALKADAPHALRDAETGERWPVIDGIPYLRVGRAALVERVLAHLDAGELDEALCALLADQDDWWTGPAADPAGILSLIKARRTATLRDAVAGLGWGRVGDYFLHRWSDPTFLAGLALLEAHWNEPICVFEFACGIGHYLRELARRGCKVAGADVVFAKLWVARHWVVGEKAQLVCFDAGSPHWPLPGAPVDLVVCHDAFYFLDDKPQTLDCLRQTAGDDGWLAISHIHNRDCPGFSAGRAVTADEVAELFPDALVYDDAELTRALIEARAPVPHEPGDLRACEAFSLVAGPGMRPAPRSVVDGLTLPKAGTALRLNPLYAPEGADYAIHWPSERYEAEYAARATYPPRSPGPEHLTFPGEIDAPETGRARVREFVDLPERW